jgi:hypothetical protein
MPTHYASVVGLELTPLRSGNQPMPMEAYGNGLGTKAKPLAINLPVCAGGFAVFAADRRVGGR